MSGIRSANYWDSIPICDPLQHRSVSDWRLFGNYNIGNLKLTNLQVPGQLTFNDDAFIIQHWYARTNLPAGHRDDLETWAATAYIEIVLGHRPMWVAPIVDLLRAGPMASDAAPRHLRWPVVLPARENLSGRVNDFGSNAYDRLSRNVQERSDHAPREARMLWLHLEGLHVPREQADEVVRQLTVANKEMTDAEQSIATWLLGLAKDPNRDEATLMALADGILEQRHRGGSSYTRVGRCCAHPVERHAYNGCAECGCGVRWPEHPDRHLDMSPEAIDGRKAGGELVDY